MPWNFEHDRSFYEGFFMMFEICQVPYFSLQIWHIIWHHAKVSYCLEHFLNFLCPFQTILKIAGMKLLSLGLSLAKLEVDLWWNSMLWTYKWFFKKFTSIISCTCSSNLGTLLPIRQEFVFFMRDGRKGSWYTGSEFVHLRWSSISEKWVGTNAKL
jgi:hypothetical protein